MSAETTASLVRLIAEIRPQAASAAGLGARLQSDLGLTSVEIIDLVVAAEDEFGVTLPDEDTGEFLDATLGELAEWVDGQRRDARRG